MKRREGHMRVVECRSLASKVGAVAMVVGLLPAPLAVAAPYTATVLIAPVDQPSYTITRAFAINGSGQVFGEAVSGVTQQPLLWTGGVPQYLPIPDGFFWDAHAGQQFLNDSGTAVTKISSASNLPGGVTNNILRWRKSGADVAADLVPPTPPSTMASLSCSDSYVHHYPMGLNNAGHVLILATDATGSCPYILWIWDGVDGTPEHFQEVTPVNSGSTGCSPTLIARFDGPHLNDQDHIAAEFGPRDGPGTTCTADLTAGLLAGGSYSPLVTLVPAGGGQGLAAGIGAFNNHDQLVAFVGDNNAPDLKLWDAQSVVDLGLGGAPSLNDLGHVLFLAKGPPYNNTVRLYKDGAATDVPLPSEIPGFVLAPGSPSPVGINSSGQLLVSMNFSGGGTFEDQVVLLTPTPPTMTLKVNGQHPSPPVVTTTGPMSLTLDVTPSALTAPLSWYWVMSVNGQVVWVTSAGLKTTPAPVLVSPPLTIANATLLNATLPAGTTLATAVFVVNGAGSAVAGDLVVATRP
jgi:hypothetical protein